MSKRVQEEIDRIGNAYRYTINIPNANEKRGHSILYDSPQAITLNILAKVFCTNGAEYSAVILPHGNQELPIYVSHPYGYGKFNRLHERLSLTQEEIEEISNRLKAVLNNNNDVDKKQSLLRYLVRCQNPFIEHLIGKEIKSLKKGLAKQERDKLEDIKNNSKSEKEVEQVKRFYQEKIESLDKIKPYWNEDRKKWHTGEYEKLVEKHSESIFPKFLNEHDLTSIIQYKSRTFQRVSEVFDRYNQSLYKGVHVEAQGVDFAYERHRQQTHEFSIGLAKKDTNPEVGCCAGCALEFKVLSLRKNHRIIVHRSADFPSNVPPSEKYKPSPLISNEEMALFKKISLFQGTENLIVREILSDKINTIDEFSHKIEELTKTSQDVDRQLKEDKDTIEVLKAENKQLIEESSATKKQLEEAQTQLKTKEEELKESQGIIDTLTKEMDKKVDTLETEKRELKDKLTIAQKQLERKDEELKEDKKVIETLQQAKKELEGKLQASEQELGKVSQNLKESQGTIVKLTEEANTWATEKSGLEGKLTTAHEQLEKKDEELKEDKDIIGVLEAENKQLIEESSTTKKQLEKTQTQLKIGSAENAELINKNQTLEGQLKKLRQELKKLPELEEKIKQLEESQKPVNVNAPSPGTNTNIEGQNLQQESILVESNLGRHSPPPSSSNEQPEVKKQKLEKVEEANLGAIAEAKQIGHGIAAVTPPPSSNIPESVPKAPGKRPESPPRAP